MKVKEKVSKVIEKAGDIAEKVMYILIGFIFGAIYAGLI